MALSTVNRTQFGTPLPLSRALDAPLCLVQEKLRPWLASLALLPSVTELTGSQVPPLRGRFLSLQDSLDEHWSLHHSEQNVWCWKKGSMSLTISLTKSREGKEGQVQAELKQEGQENIILPPERIYVFLHALSLSDLVPHLFLDPPLLFLFPKGIHKEITCIEETPPVEAPLDVNARQVQLTQPLFDKLKSLPLLTSTFSDELEFRTGNPIEGSQDWITKRQTTAAAVCRICNSKTLEGRGTGFVVARNLLLTNHHVLKSKEECHNYVAQFFYDDPLQRPPIEVSFDPEKVFVTSDTPTDQEANEQALDFTLVELKDHPELEAIFACPISLKDGKAAVKDTEGQETPYQTGTVHVIHHPLGLKKKVSSSNAPIRLRNTCEIEHTATTEEGSSGSPIFDGDHRLIGLHFRGVKTKQCNAAIRIEKIREQLMKRPVWTRIKDQTYSSPPSPIAWTTTQSSIQGTKGQVSLEYLKKRYTQKSSIERFSGESLPLGACYLNVQIVKEEEQKEKEEKFKEQKIRNQQLSTFEEIHAAKKPIVVENIFPGTKQPVRFFVLGKAGIGKTTAFHHIAFRWAQEKLWEKHLDWLFWIPLRELNKEKMPSLKDYLYQQWFHIKMKSEEFDALWENEISSSKKVVLLLDGYDELADREKLLSEWIDPYVDFHVLISSRPYLTPSQGFERLEIIGFTDENIHQYAAHCLKEKAEGFTHFLTRNPTLSALAHIPLQLDFLCALWQRGKITEKSESLPMTQLYQLLDRDFKEHFAKKTKNLSIEKCWENLCQVAFIAMKEKSLIFSKESINISDSSFEDILKTGLLKQAEPYPEYYFLHLTFQEYYAACHIVSLLEKVPKEVKDFLREEKYNPRMQIVLWFVAGLCAEKPLLLKKYLNFFLEEPRDLIGIYETGLLIRFLEESRMKALPQLEEFVTPWLQFNNRNDLYRIDKLRAALQLSPSVLCKICLPGLQRLLKDEDPNVRSSACYALSELPVKDKAIIDGLILLLKDEDRIVRGSACYALGALQVKDKTVIDEIILLLKDKDPYIRISACRALGQLQVKDKAVIDEIILLLKDEDRNVRGSACYALGALQVKDKAIIDGLIRLLKDEDPDVRKSTCYALGALQVKDKAVIDGLILLLKDEDQYVRGRACEALGKLQVKDKAVIDKIILLLKDKDRDARSGACEALSELQVKDKAVIDEIILLLKDKDRDVRSSACYALGALQVKDKAIIDGLIRLLKDKDRDVRSSACEALGQLQVKDKAVIDGLIRLLKDKDQYVRSSACKALGKLQVRDKAVIDGLILLLKDEDQYVKNCACEALSEFQVKDQAVIDGLILLLKDKDFRGSPLRALIRLESLREIPLSLWSFLLRESFNAIVNGCLARCSASILISLFSDLKYFDLPALKLIAHLIAEEQSALYLYKNQLFLQDKNGKKPFAFNSKIKDISSLFKKEFGMKERNLK